MNVLMFCLLKDAIRKENELAEYRLARERGKNETEMYYSSIQHFEEQCKMIHEFRNHLHCISMLAKHNEIEKLNDYISKIQDNTISNQDVINTNHQIINRILNSKYHEACKKNILMIFKLSDLSEITIEDQDLVILLSNLINNAFEACEQCENKVIKIKIEKSDCLVISILNTFKQELIMKDGRILSHKTEHVQYHGFGIENIKDVIAKYKGIYHIKTENDEFIFTIFFPNMI
ncbi:MAG: sensor histidine kinase [Lachnospiraceae bacterium]